MAIYLAFVLEFETVGLWLGFLCGVPFLAFFTGWLALKSDWQKLADNSERRIIQDSSETQSYFELWRSSQSDDGRKLSDIDSNEDSYDSESSVIKNDKQRATDDAGGDSNVEESIPLIKDQEERN